MNTATGHRAAPQALAGDVLQGDGIVRRRPFGANPTVGERGTDTQRRILAAGLDVFADLGFDGARVELITERAGCSRPAFYQYFSSKDDVFWKLAGRLGHEMVELGERLGPISSDADGVASLERWIADFATLHETYSAIFASFQAAARDQPATGQSSVSISDRLAAAILRAFGIDPTSDAQIVLATGIVGVMIRCSFYWEEMGDLGDRREIVQGLAQIVHRLFAGPINGVNVVPATATKTKVPAPPHVARTRDLRTRGEKTRQRLLDAGAKVLPAHGYLAARVDDIVEAAGVSHGSFYRYFENKDDFFRVLAESASLRMIELLDAFPSTGSTDDLRAWTAEWFGTYESNGGVISVWQEMQESDPALAAFSRQVAAAVVARLARVLDQRGFGNTNVDSLAFLAVTERLPYSVFTLRFSERDDAIDAMVRIIRNGLLGVKA
ncbi:MAG: TetR/AcrR family transcriptional regulator, partial [Actinobacteria bacterium]|nr:TetR/AcrR family transcriptional regulator [Actinomycetota bacterium]